MSLVRGARALALGAFLFSIGCGEAAPGAFELAESPAFELQGGGPAGSGGINGASPLAYHANVMELLAALAVPAADPSDPSAVNPAIEATGLLDTSGGRQVFRYATRCALPAGTNLASGNKTYEGEGILRTTSTWLTTGLATSAQEDVLTCIVAHLNPLGFPVPIFLSGPSVAGTENAGDLGFTVTEALWQVRIPGPGQAPVYHAWPRVDLLSTCGLCTQLSWITRLCGTLLNTCGVSIRYDMASACTGKDGRFTCNGKPAIQTTLEAAALCDLHLPL
ncbi:hypothetical protein [Polyangium sp. 15x6]|uniref:hypothetical protein n=1 Tax=Polyangium sp. 15x6 TaxID=3042687 RepID=UPI00249C16DE|nr:hypothetical protein [Polyangium sp. 15x6]MDI3284281.1 hypothetical protein [Polyangium sp. 15x6]